MILIAFVCLFQGHLLLGTWVDDIAKCGEIIDFDRHSASNVAQYPLPELKLLDADEVLQKAREWFKSSDNLLVHP